uniref:V-ATPase 14 kDa subunit n=2 Tax=Passeriformes TaxID=9126 RepID=A0A8C3NMW6_GEOPR
MAGRGKLIAVMGDEDTVTGFLLGGIGELDKHRRPNFLVVEKETSLAEIEETFRGFLAREDVGMILISQALAEQIRPAVAAHARALPAVLEIPSKDHPYDPARDSPWPLCTQQRVTGTPRLSPVPFQHPQKVLHHSPSFFTLHDLPWHHLGSQASPGGLHPREAHPGAPSPPRAVVPHAWGSPAHPRVLLGGPWGSQGALRMLGGCGCPVGLRVTRGTWHVSEGAWGCHRGPEGDP